MRYSIMFSILIGCSSEPIYSPTIADSGGVESSTGETDGDDGGLCLEYFVGTGYFCCHSKSKDVLCDTEELKQFYECVGTVGTIVDCQRHDLGWCCGVQN